MRVPIPLKRRVVAGSMPRRIGTRIVAPNRHTNAADLKGGRWRVAV
jgi:hypothetical protein